MATVKFKTKPKDCTYMGETEPAYSYVQVPKITRNHCDMNAFRNSRRFGPYANSDLFPAMINREVGEKIGNRRIRINELPPGVNVDTSGFLAVVTISIED